MCRNNFTDIAKCDMNFDELKNLYGYAGKVEEKTNI